MTDRTKKRIYTKALAYIKEHLENGSEPIHFRKFGAYLWGQTQKLDMNVLEGYSRNASMLLNKLHKFGLIKKYSNIVNPKNGSGYYGLTEKGIQYLKQT
ncbi:MAG: hypothetical protein IKO41_17655 [Lachnospiraceae bacterium]|nr:hypothetical protein [Lachnospiraceae bacterium]